MEFSEVLRRRIVRHDTDQPLAPEVVERVLDAALRAPSAGFSQGWAFLVLTEPADRARSWPYVPTRATQTPTMVDAPLVVVPLAHEAAHRDRYARPDKAAVDEGLGACLFGIQAEQRAGASGSSACRTSTSRSAGSPSATATQTSRRRTAPASRSAGVASRTSCTGASGAPGPVVSRGQW